jgi:hypothetical protein
MSLESGTFISDLVVTNPLNTDQKAQGAGHLRLLKSTVKATFPAITGAVNTTHTELNFVAGVTSAIQTQLAAEIARAAPLVSPALTGTPTAPTAAPGTSTTQLSTTAFNAAAVLVETNRATAAEALKANTASPTFTGTVIIPSGASIAGFAPLASPAFTGVPTAPTASVGVSNTQIASTAFVSATAFQTALPGQTGNAGKFLTTDGTNASFASAKTPVFAYEDRGNLRALTPGAGDNYVVSGLGLFVWESGSTEPDDDESSFATASGVWLIQAVSFDFVDAAQLPDESVQDENDEDEPLRFASSFASKVLTGTAINSITSVASISSASFIGTVTGSSVGDRVIANPPAQLGASSINTGRLSHHAFVSSADTVTIIFSNPSAASATITAGTWNLTVIKS